jgi:hypothetical protein
MKELQSKLKKPKGTAIRKTIILALALTLVLCLVTSTSAFLPALIKAILLAKELYDAIGDFVGKMAVRIAYGLFLWWAYFQPMKTNVQNLPNLILLNPVIMTQTADGDYVGNPPIKGLSDFFQIMTWPFYILAIISTAFYLLFMSGSPLGRARAKSSLIKLIISMGVVVLTIPIVQLMLDASEYLTGGILNLVDVQPGIDALLGSIDGLWHIFILTVAFSYWNAIYLVMFSIIMFSGPFILIAVRFFMVIQLIVLFPLTVLLFSFYFTRRLGSQMMEATVSWIFVQPLMALILVAISTAAYSMPMLNDGTVAMSFGLAGFLALITAPLMAIKVMDWLAMLMIMLTAIEFPGMHGLIGMVDELQVEGPSTEEFTPPPPIRPHGMPPRH